MSGNVEKRSNGKEELTKDPPQATLLGTFERKIVSYDRHSTNFPVQIFCARLPTGGEDYYCCPKEGEETALPLEAVYP